MIKYAGNWDELPGCIVRGCDPNDINQGMWKMDVIDEMR